MNSRSVILWGGTSECARVMNRFEGADKYVGFISNENYKIEATYNGIELLEPEMLNDEAYSKLRIVITSRDGFYYHFGKLIRDYHVDPNRVLRDVEWYSEIIDDDDVNVNETISFQVHLAEHCNLNCRGCTHFSPLANKEFVNLESFRRDFERLGRLYNGKAGVIHLLGGEPLLNPNIVELLSVSRNCFKYGKIILVTNGILLMSMDDNFWKSCRENEIVIAPTKYPLKIDYDQIEKKAKREEVGFYYFGNTTNALKYLYCKPIAIDEKIDLHDSYFNCSLACGGCYMLSHGRMFKCTLPANLHHFSSFFGLNMPDFDSDGIDIYEARDRFDISNFLIKPIRACKFCDLAHTKRDIPFEASRKSIEEWIIR